MDGDQLGPTPEQAREQLAVSHNQLSSSGTDRRVHAGAIAVVGLDTGLFMATQNIVHGWGRAALSILFIALWIGAVTWTEKLSRTVPRSARRWSLWGIAGSFAVGLFAVLPWLNLHAQSSPNTWPMALLGALVVAAPSLGAAMAVARRAR